MWNPDSALQNFVQLGLVEELRVSGFDGLELDCDFFAVRDVNAEIDVAETAAADFSDLITIKL